MTKKRGIILGINLSDTKSPLKEGDLVCIKDSIDYDNSFYTLRKIDPRYLKQPDTPDNPAMFIINDKTSNLEMNFERDELCKSNYAVFDYDAYYNQNKKIKLGEISINDLRNLKAKYVVENDLPTTEIDNILIENLIELIIEGDIIEHQIGYDEIESSKSTRTLFKM